MAKKAKEVKKEEAQEKEAPDSGNQEDVSLVENSGPEYTEQ